MIDLRDETVARNARPLKVPEVGDDFREKLSRGNRLIKRLLLDSLVQLRMMLEELERAERLGPRRD